MNPYQPDDLPLENLDYRQLFSLVGEANAELARYDGVLRELQAGSGRRAAVLCFADLLELAEGRAIFNPSTGE